MWITNAAFGVQRAIDRPEGVPLEWWMIHGRPDDCIRVDRRGIEILSEFREAEMWRRVRLARDDVGPQR